METQVNYNQSAVNTSQQTAPVLSFKDWMITLLIMAIPLVNIIMLFVWAFGGSSTNPNKSNYAKAALLWIAIGIVLYVVFVVFIFGSLLAGIASNS
ncbi:hypothetical protein ACFFNY_28835 [Paenibacillus hodogayensis]|uniref:Cardiolipin synthase N-terminal domain-containing protein n=1 Tax=Paenibacillus hodogayensis TaxID=279208 RepID=A0ABV5W5M4_9BACL